MVIVSEYPVGAPRGIRVAFSCGGRGGGGGEARVEGVRGSCDEEKSGVVNPKEGGCKGGEDIWREMFDPNPSNARKLVIHEIGEGKRKGRTLTPLY